MPKPIDEIKDFLSDEPKITKDFEEIINWEEVKNEPLANLPKAQIDEIEDFLSDEPKITKDLQQIIDWEELNSLTSSTFN